MLNEEQIRTEIVRLAIPLAKPNGHIGLFDATDKIIRGLAWALIGKETPDIDMANRKALYEFLQNDCGIPCKFVDARSYTMIQWDQAWMKSHLLPMD